MLGSLQTVDIWHNYRTHGGPAKDIASKAVMVTQYVTIMGALIFCPPVK